MSRSPRPTPQPQQSAEQLAAAAAAGCCASFELLVRRLGPRLLGYLRRRVGDAHAAEDLVQEAFLKAYRNLGRYDPSRSFATWLFAIATRLAASYGRARRRAISLENFDPPDEAERGPLEAAARRERHENLWARASQTLPGEQFTALWLRYVEEMAVREIASAMGRTVSSVKVLLHRARRRLIAQVAEAPAAAPASRQTTGCVPQTR